MEKSELITSTRLSVRSVNALESIGIKTVEEILTISEEELFSIRNLGTKSVSEILDFIRDCNKYFSSDHSEPQNIDEWIVKNYDAILSYAKQNDLSIYDMNLSAKAFNALRLNDCLLLSQFILKTNAEINDICFDNRGVAEEIALFSREWLYSNREKISPTSNDKEDSNNIKSDTHLLKRCSDDLGTGTGTIILKLENEGMKEIFLQYVVQHDKPIEELKLSTRSFNCLKRNRINLLSEVISIYPDGYAGMRNMGAKSVEEIKNRIEVYFMEHYKESENESTVSEDSNESEEFNIELLSAIQLFHDSNTKEKAWDYIKRNDIDISSMNFSNRSLHALLGSGISKFSMLLEIYPLGISSLRNLGAKSIDEIKSIVFSKLEKLKPTIVAFCSGNTQSLFSDEFIIDTVLKCFENKAFVGVSYKEIKEKFSDDVDENRIKKAIGSLIRDGVLEYVDFRCYRVFPSIIDVLSKKNVLMNDERKDYLLRKYNGETLEEIAKSEGITRERVRQICDKQYRNIKHKLFAETGLEYLDEDYYAYLYSTYDGNKELLQNYLSLPVRTLSYLKNTYTMGKEPLSNAINDSKLDLNLKLRIRDYLNKDKVTINGELIDQNKSAIEEYILENYCEDELKYSEFVRIYNDILSKNNIENANLYITDEAARTRSNHLADSKKCLWKQGERLRYYDIDSRDYTELLDTINLSDYANIEISTLKFIEDYPEIMEKYDIRDQYELHNLLKKTVGNDSANDIRFGRQPIISFGQSNRVELYSKILNIVSPVTAEEFAEYIHMENGFDKLTILASSEIQQLSKYYHDGVYSVDFKHFPDDHVSKLGALLENDFYYIDEIVKIYENNFRDADLECINPRSLKSIGFNVFSKYAVKNYPTAEAYFRNLLTKDDVFDISPYRSRYGTIQMYNQLVLELRKECEIFLFENDQYINCRRLCKAGITKETIESFCNEVNDFVTPNTYFTIKSLRNDGFSHDLDDLGFDDIFYAGILAVSPFFCYQRVYGNIVLYSGNMNKQFSIKSFIQNMLEEYDSVDVDDFIDDMYEKYGIRIPEKYDVTSAVTGTQMYYDSIMNKIYSSKNQYYSDLDD